ncbi:MAG: lytic murein transglycosylase [Proteobacteria bacterium]|nr:lytic murein transglycosylase [Pseudomonadota bacterium]
MKIVARAFLLLMCLAAPAQAEDFSSWLSTFRQEALQQGISERTLDAAFASTEPDEVVLRLDRKQPEGRLTLAQYLKNTLTKKRYQRAQEAYDENKELLQKIGKEFGVQPRFIVALWGVETDFGRNTGDFIIINSLATLAYDGRRADFFRGELMDALRIMEAEGLATEDMYGSWAGALGQCQFMPSTFLKHAVDYDKDGKRDVWGNQGDVFASIANYLKSLGWNEQGGWGRPVKLPRGFNTSLADIKQSRPLSEWKKLGVRKSDGKPLPEGEMNASLIFVGEGEGAPTYIIYDNYKALLQWNRSRYFATSVGMLADSIRP